MSSTQKKIVAVTGSTGIQGGGVAKILLADGTFAVRAITRNVDSKKAQGQAQGPRADVVAADWEDVESLKKAFKGAWGVFGITVWNLFETHHGNQADTQAHEEQHGRNLVDAAEAEGIQHFVWSTLPHIDGHKVYHFESKANVDDYLRTKKVPFSLILTSFYYSNLTGYGFLRKDGDELVLQIPLPASTQIPSFDSHDTGSWVLAALKSEPSGKTFNAFGQSLSPIQYAAVLSRVSGKEIKVKEVSLETFKSKEFIDNLGQELWLNMKAFNDNLFVQDYKKSREQHPKAQTFEEFAKTDAALKTLVGY
ncbi:hypothetical protein BS47DRAFT_1397994 [Hydnum rufescens UP504]|uniref:NmrA-like domain-containing protein n=1 Tax=Hydnum rufescens UP504 TaxID=1448309 RepID=A0A9P6ALX9_9AGAM|nr:hypothetical protein BS47DRAFT_1397994 [Hydnum rufescens UP504]